MRRLLLPTLSGVLYFLSWIGFGIWPLAFVCFVPLLWALRDATPRRALWLGAWMGFVTHLGGYTWIMHVLQVFASAPLPLAFAGYLVLCAIQGLLFGVMSYVLVWLGRRTHWPAATLLPIALVATEFGYPLLFQGYTAELHARGAELVIWPEVGFNTRPLRPGDTDGRAIIGPVPVAAIIGVIRVDGRKVWNSAVVIDDRARIGDHYDKIQLLAFGEYIPGGEWFPELYEWSPLSSPLARGQSTAPLRWRSWRFATFSCYEDILPGIVRSIMADHGEGRAHAMVNLTNDSWYGAGHEQEQHLMLAAARSIEHRRWLLRATSTGISAFVDATGRVLQRIGRNQRGVALAEVPMLQGTTPYQLLGDWPGWVALAIIAGVALREAARARSQRRHQHP